VIGYSRGVVCPAPCHRCDESFPLPSEPLKGGEGQAPFGPAALLSRRGLVAAAALLGAGSVAPADAAAEPPPQVTQQEAHYQPAPKNGVRCAFCTFFRPPAGCTVVQGVISPQGWCKFFDLPD
jgi:hypothetical protein